MHQSNDVPFGSITCPACGALHYHPSDSCDELCLCFDFWWANLFNQPVGGDL